MRRYMTLAVFFLLMVVVFSLKRIAAARQFNINNKKVTTTNIK